MADAVTPPSSNTGNLASLASLTPLIINLLKGTSQPNPGALLGTIPGGQDLLNGVVGQQQQQAPLRQAVTQQAMNMLPNSAFPGGRPALAPVGAGAAPVTGSSSGLDLSKLLGAGAAGAGLGALLSKLMGGSGAGSGGDIGKLIQALKNVMSGKPSGLSTPGSPLLGGNQTPFTGWNDNGNTGQPTGDFPDGLNNGPTPNVTTSTTFNGVPGGYPDNPEDPNSIDPNAGGLFSDPPQPGPDWGG